MASLLQEALPAQTLVVAIDPGKVCNRVLLASGERGLIGESVSLPTLREGLDELVRLIGASGAVGEPVIAIEATGSLHGPWTAELERRFPGRVRVLAPSETQAARAQLGSRRFKSDDRDCAALVWLARQGLGRSPDEPALGALTGAVRHRRQLVSELKVLRQRLHGQLNALCPGLSAPQGQGRTLDLLRPSGRAVLACAAAFAGRAPSVRSLVARAPGRLGRAYAEYWVQRWRACLPPPADAELRAERLRLDLTRLEALVGALATVDAQTAGLLAKTPGQVLTSLPGVAVVRAAAFAAHSLPSERFPTVEHLYSSTGLAPASYESGTISSPGGISRQGLAEHRDALMTIAWASRKRHPPSVSAHTSTARAASRRSRCGWRSHDTPALSVTPSFATRSPTTRRAIVSRAGAGGDGGCSSAARRRNLACRPPASAAPNGDNEKPAARRRPISLPIPRGPTRTTRRPAPRSPTGRRRSAPACPHPPLTHERKASRRSAEPSEQPDDLLTVRAFDQDVARPAAGSPLDQDANGLAAFEVCLADHASAVRLSARG